MLFTAFMMSLPLLCGVQDIPTVLPMTEKAIEVVAEERINEFERKLSQFLCIPDEERTFDNTIRYWDFLSGEMSQAIDYLNFGVAGIHPEQSVRDCASRVSLQLQNCVLSAFSAHPEILKVCESIEKKHLLLSEDENYYLTELLKTFRRMGLHLPEEKRALFLKLKGEIADLENQFNRNVAEDVPLFLVSKEDLKGVNAHWLAGQQCDGNGFFHLRCNLSTYTTILSQCSNAQVRKAVHRLYNNRAYPENEEIILQLIEKKNQLADLLDFSNFAEMDLSMQMAGSIGSAHSFLKEVKEKAAIAANREFQKVIENLPEGVVLTDEGQMHKYDQLYAFEVYRNKYFSIDKSAISAYFPLEKVLENLLRMYGQFFNLVLQEVPHHIPIPHVKTVEVRQRSGELLGIVLLDLFSRQGKSAHVGICTPLLLPLSLPEGQNYPALTLLITNLSSPVADACSLLSYEEVSNLFHEFGHAIHATLARNSFFAFCGMAVPYDFTELPSQLLEKWLLDPCIIKQISSHYVTGKSLPDEWVEKIIKAQTFGWPSLIQWRCYLSQLSLGFFSGFVRENPTHFMHELWAREYPHFCAGEYNHFHTSWWHVPNYGPKYYSYLWSEAFAFDVFEKIQREGLLNPEVGAAYTRAILAKGGSQKPEQMLIEFLGREPILEPFFNELLK